jgi:hypothetical protein
MEPGIVELIRDYVNTVDGLLASYQEDKPRFSKEAVDRTVSALVRGGFVNPDSAVNLGNAFLSDPDKALESLQKLAAWSAAPAEAQGHSLGSGDRPAKQSRSGSEPASYRLMSERFGAR